MPAHTVSTTPDLTLCLAVGLKLTHLTSVGVQGALARAQQYSRLTSSDVCARRSIWCALSTCIATPATHVYTGCVLMWTASLQEHGLSPTSSARYDAVSIVPSIGSGDRWRRPIARESTKTRTAAKSYHFTSTNRRYVHTKLVLEYTCRNNKIKYAVCKYTPHSSHVHAQSVHSALAA